MNSQGRLKKTLKTRCKECGTLLQLRTISIDTIEFGEPISVDEDFTICPECETLQPMKKKSRKRIREE